MDVSTLCSPVLGSTIVVIIPKISASFLRSDPCVLCRPILFFAFLCKAMTRSLDIIIVESCSLYADILQLVGYNFAVCATRNPFVCGM